ncbi:hypothetical protein PV10_07511 [Exophiala mesophila]|uniref:Pre-mRNA-splicing factor SYF2 n=1 Tax=Exophiala mesophila TaxID=212818 RepID=A0A0D1WMD7_EXOME|nr:uncharacterized protein PV10_07511 [Exophiala mesophila]KIV90180.1 hypothetical protein PV10_07511 [Exophiala mesophila]
MPAAKRRKLSQGEEEREEKVEPRMEPPAPEPTTTTSSHNGEEPPEKAPESEATPTPTPTPTPASKVTTATPSSSTNTDRLARFAALKSRAAASSKSNLAETKAEANRAAVDPTVLANLARRSAIASHNLLKADTEEEGGEGAFERKRAWDYTIEESERWDERVSRKKHARDNVFFQDYSTEAAKIYDKQMRELEKSAAKEGGRNRADYEAQKAEIINTAARTGGLEIVEMENGELVAIDKDGRFYADHDSVGFVEQKPKRENVDRLVADLKKADDMRMKKRKDRGRDDESGDVTYINEKNKQFNLKLARFYDRYTTEIRESFERGTAM